MRCHPGRWMWGLIPVAILIWLALMGEHRNIQADLRTRAAEQLSKAGLGWAAAGFTGRDGIVIGRAVSEEDRRRAAAIASNVWGVRTIENHAMLSSGRESFRWSAKRQPSSIHLTGFVPTEAARTRIVALTRSRFPTLKVEDRMTVARGASVQNNWLPGAEFAMGQLRRLTSGSRVDLDGQDLMVKGKAGSARDYKLVRGELAQNLPNGIRLKDEKVLPPSISPYVWGAIYKGNQLELTGHVPSDKQRDEVFAHAKKIFRKATIIDRMTTASGEPRDWQIAAMRALSRLGELKQGEIAVSDTDLLLRGVTEKEQTANAVSRALKEQVPASFSVTDDIIFKKPAIPIIKPYVTVIEVGKVSSRVSGYVPGGDARGAIVSAVKLIAKADAVLDDAKLGAGADKGWLACLRAGLSGLKKIGGGKLVLTGRRLEMTGQSSDEALIKETNAATRAAINRACDLHAKIALIELPEPDLFWVATRHEDGIRLTGEVPDKATKLKIHARAKEMFPQSPVIDTTKVKSGLSAKWPRVALSGIELLAKLREGRSEISGQQLTVAGQAPDTVTATAIRKALKRDLPHGYTGIDAIKVRSAAMLWADQEAKRKAAQDAERKHKAAAKAKADKEAAKFAAEEAAARKRAKEAEDRRHHNEARKAKAIENARTDAARAAAQLQRDIARKAKQKAPAANKDERRKRKVEIDCRDAMRATVRKSRIRFARGRADIRKGSYATLDKLAKVVNGCPEAMVEIEGHADFDGIARFNKRLSKRRAEAVMRYLIKTGIEARRLRANGYGSTRPLVPNTTRANKAYNRRIDFTVKVK